MKKAGKAFRGYFPVQMIYLNDFTSQLGGELTGKKQDWKEGLYFGAEQTIEQAKDKPMHGPNQWPSQVPKLKETV